MGKPAKNAFAFELFLFDNESDRHINKPPITKMFRRKKFTSEISP
jgi:hypothetical protein